MTCGQGLNVIGWRCCQCVPAPNYSRRNQGEFMKRFAVLFMLSLLASAAHGQVYKCTDTNGKTIFSDKPCAEATRVIEKSARGSNAASASSGIGAATGGPSSSISLADGSVLNFKKILAIEVKTPLGYRTGRQGMHVYYEGTDRIVAFENLVSMTVVAWDEKGCGNYSHLCSPQVRIKTQAQELTVRYKALRNIKVLIEDKLDGVEKELTVWFANRNRPHIQSIRF